MTYEEVVSKLKNNKAFSILDEKTTGNSRQIKLSNGAIINCFNNGNHNVQGKNIQNVKAFLDNTMIKEIARFLSFMVMMILHEHSLRLCYDAGI